MPRRDGILRRLIDPTRIEYGIASSVIIGAVSLVDPARLSCGGRVAFRCLAAAVTSALVLVELRRVDSFEADPVAKAGVAVGVGGAVLGLSELSERLDARIIGGLRRAGVRHPRVLVAVTSTLASIVAFRSGDQRPSESLNEWPTSKEDVSFVTDAR